MKDLLNGVCYELVSGSVNSEISKICIDSKEACDNSLFVCLVGVNADGHNFLETAYNQGCRNFLVEREINFKDANVFKVDNTREALSIVAQNFYNHPADKLTTIAITGTKGKTTTASMIKHMIESSEKKCGLIGTLGVFTHNKFYKTMNTTPESIDIQKYFSEMVDEGCEYVVMEVSSQALKVGRVNDMIFDYGIFTNLSCDHIGKNEHKDYDEYKRCKAKLFEMCKVGILNKDDLEFKEMIKNSKCEVITYGIENDAFYKVSNYELLNDDGKIGMKFKINGQSYEVCMPGKFSIYNSLAAISLAKELKITDDIIKMSLKDFRVKGRCELINISNNFSLLIDYAHEAMSLESLLLTIKEYKPKRIVTLFGCGGNRSKLRRYEMGEISGSYSDLTIITEDNSRFENVLDIINDIKKGISKTKGKYISIPNRRDAIKFAIENAQDGDIILLCGKGHEDYQEIEGKRYHLDERELIDEIVLELSKNK